MEKKPKIVISISGGRTSAMMAYLIKKKLGATHDIVCIFANTSREKEETLVFLDRVDKLWGLNIVWVEAVVHHGKRKASTHKIVDFIAAKRDGSVFAEVIKKYGIPCKQAPHCTRETKSNPIKSCAKALGFGRYGKDYQIAIGYRNDEQKRIKQKKIQKEKHFYFLNDLGIRKADVARFWSKMPFDLELKDYEGNCKLCYKKSKRKLLTQVVEHPEDAAWIIEMQNLYGMVCPEKYKGGLPLRFFRERESMEDIIEESKLPFDKAIDKSKDQIGFDMFFDQYLDEEDSDCGDRCEPFAA